MDAIQVGKGEGQRARLELQVLADAGRGAHPHHPVGAEVPLAGQRIGGRERSVLDQLAQHRFGDSGALGKLGQGDEHPPIEPEDVVAFSRHGVRLLRSGRAG